MRVVVFVVLCAGCGPQAGDPPPPPLEEAVVEPVCGRESPVRLLPLDADQAPIDDPDAVTAIADRIYVIAGRGSFDSSSFADQTTVYSMQPCGEDPRSVATDVNRVLENPQWPGLLLGHTTDADLVALDPEGEADPQVLMADVPLSGWTDSGIALVEGGEDGEVSRLILRPFPAMPGDAEPPPIVLHEWTGSANGVVRRNDEALLLLGSEVLRISIPDGAATVELTGASGFSVSDDGRFVAWTGARDAEGFASVRVRDRDTGSELDVGATDRLLEVANDHLLLYSQDLPDISHRLVLLPELRVIDVPSGVFLSQRIDATRWLAWQNPTSWLLFDIDSGDTRRLSSRHGTAFFRHDHLVNLVSDEPGDFGVGNQGYLEASWFDGRRTTQLASQATAGYRSLADGRIATPLDVDDSGLGLLALTNVDGITRWQLDTHVLARFAKQQVPEAVGEAALLYFVSDGDRSGLWLTGLVDETAD